MIVFGIKYFQNYFDGMSSQWKGTFDNEAAFKNIRLSFRKWTEAHKLNKYFNFIQTNHCRINNQLYSVTTEPLFEIRSDEMYLMREGNIRVWHDIFSCVIPSLVKQHKELTTKISHNEAYNFLCERNNEIFFLKDLKLEKKDVSSMMYCQYFSV